MKKQNMKQVFIKTIKLNGYKTEDSQPTCTIGNPNCCPLLGTHNNKPACMYDGKLEPLKQYPNGYLMVSKDCPVWIN